MGNDIKTATTKIIMKKTPEFKLSDEELLEKKEESTELRASELIEGTPFMAIKVEDKWYLTLGKYRLTEGGTKEDTIEESKNASWWRVMQVVTAVVDASDEIQNLKQRLKNAENTIEKLIELTDKKQAHI